MAGLLNCSHILLQIIGNIHLCIDGIHHALLIDPAFTDLAIGSAMITRGTDNRQADGALDAAHEGVPTVSTFNANYAKFLSRQNFTPLSVLYFLF